MGKIGSNLNNLVSDVRVATADLMPRGNRTQARAKATRYLTVNRADEGLLVCMKMMLAFTAQKSIYLLFNLTSSSIAHQYDIFEHVRRTCIG